MFETFRTWNPMVENKIILKMRSLRSDNGGEYKDTEFKEFSYEHGIKMGEPWRIYINRMV